MQICRITSPTTAGCEERGGGVPTPWDLSALSWLNFKVHFPPLLRSFAHSLLGSFSRIDKSESAGLVFRRLTTVTEHGCIKTQYRWQQRRRGFKGLKPELKSNSVIPVKNNVSVLLVLFLIDWQQPAVLALVYVILPCWCCSWPINAKLDSSPRRLGLFGFSSTLVHSSLLTTNFSAQAKH